MSPYTSFPLIYSTTPAEGKYNPPRGKVIKNKRRRAHLQRTKRRKR